MGTAIAVLVLGLLDTTSSAGPTGPPSEDRVQDGFAVGVFATPALEGGGPWFMPGIRLSAPVAPKIGLDLEAGRIYGGSNRFAEIRTFLGGQLRFRRASTQTGKTTKYWFVGLTRLDRKRPNDQGAFVRNDPDTAVVFGHGWKDSYANGARVLAEIGFGGGEGYLAYVKVGLQWGRRSERSQ